MAANFGLYYCTLLVAISGLKDTVIGLTIEGPQAGAQNETEYIIVKGAHLNLTCYHEHPVTWTFPQNKIHIEPNIKYTKDERGYVGIIEVHDVDHPSVGFYTCMERNKPYSKVSVYVYVEGASSLYVEPTCHFIMGLEFFPVIIPCKPTSPNIYVDIYDMNTMSLYRDHILLDVKNPDGSIWSYDWRYGLEWQNATYTFRNKFRKFVCVFNSIERNLSNVEISFDIEIIKYYTHIDIPKIFNDTMEDFFSEDYPLNLQCIMNLQPEGHIPALKWLKDGQEVKNSSDGRINIPQEPYYTQDSVHLNLTIKHLIKGQDDGEYMCMAYDKYTNNNNSISVAIQKSGVHFIRIEEENNIQNIISDAGKEVTYVAYISAFPRAVVKWFNNRNDTIESKGNYNITVEGMKHILKIINASVHDIGNYTIKATNQYGSNSSSFHLLVKSTPIIQLNINPLHFEHKNGTVYCLAYGYPQPEIQMFFKPCENNSCEFQKLLPQETNRDLYTTKMSAIVETRHSGYVKCIAFNNIGSDMTTRYLNRSLNEINNSPKY